MHCRGISVKNGIRMCGRAKIRWSEEEWGQLLGGTRGCVSKLCCLVAEFQKRDAQGTVEIKMGQDGS